MGQNGTESSLTQRQIATARLVAEDELTDQQIAAKISIGRGTLGRWKQLPAFRALVQQISAELEAETLKFAIAKRRNRVKALDDRWKRLQRLIEARAEEHKAIAGGDTGLLTRTTKVIGAGKYQQQIEEYAVDTALLKEMREHEKQSAQEIGQWTEKSQTDTELTIHVVYDEEDAPSHQAPPRATTGET